MKRKIHIDANYVRSIIVRYFKTFLSFVFLFIMQFVRFKEKRIVFSQSRERYSGNSKYLFEYLSSAGYDVCWLYTSVAQKNKIPKKYHSSSLRRNSFSGFLYSITSHVAVISHGSGDFGLYWHFVKRRCVINLWHGTGIKFVGLLDHKNLAKDSKEYISKETKYYDGVTVASHIFRYLFSASHGIDVRKIFVTGDPRIDFYVKGREVVKKSKDPAKSFKILYAPTFRDNDFSGNLFFPFPDFTKSSMMKLLSENQSLQIYLRPHPNDIRSIDQAKKLEETFSDQVVNLSSTIFDDVDDCLFEFNLIISDYSSIYLEPLLDDVPCIFVPFDFNQYMEIRGMAFDYDLVTPGPKVFSFQEFTAAIEDARIGAPLWASQRNFVKRMFFTYEDSGACARICDLISDFSESRK